MANARIEITMSQKDQEKFAKYCLAHFNEIYEEMWRRTAPLAYDAAKSITDYAVDRWYGGYSPHSYQRKMDLMNAFDFGIRNGYEFNFELGSEFMKYYHHQGNEFVYVNSFEHGFHGGSFGGADENGLEVGASGPRWRRPKGFFCYWWNRTAPRTTPPRDIIIAEWDNFVDTVLIPKQKKIFAEILDKIRSKLGV